MTADVLLTANSPSSDVEAAHLAAQGVPLSEICARYNPILSPQAVKAAIARGRHALDTSRPKPTPPAKPAPHPVAPVPVAAKPKATVPLEADELLDWAEKDGPNRARTLASRVRMHLGELGALHSRHAETTEARKFVEALEKQLADAKAELRRITGAAPAPTATAGPPVAASTSTIRAWAVKNGHELSDRGRVPASAVAAYQAAHADGGEVQ